MAIVVCPLSRVKAVAAARRPSRVVSLLDPHTPFPRDHGVDDESHLKMHIHDIAEHEEGAVLPNATHMRQILAFVSSWERDAPILIHCWAGISRSSATAFITACVHNPGVDEEEIAWVLRRASATASPNPLLVALADAELGRGGRLIRAATAIGKGFPRWPAIEQATPFELPSRFSPSSHFDENA